MIDDELMAELRRRVDSLRDRRWESVTYEIMDDGLFLLMTVYVAIAQSEKENLREIGRLLGQVCAELVPPRSDEYSWMINIQLIYGGFVQSFMGGWLGMPDLLPDK